MVQVGVISPATAAAAARTKVPDKRRQIAFLAPQFADRLRRTLPREEVVRTLISAPLQRGAERIAAGALVSAPPEVNVAMLVIENKTMAVRAYVGGGDYHSTDRAGQVDLVQAVRSPGSALKPLIYGIAFDRLVVHPETIITDQHVQFGGYEPKNFTGGYVGDLTIRSALIKSLNTPAVAVLDRVGVGLFLTRLRAAGTPLAIGEADDSAGLAVGLGGGGMSLFSLARIFAGLANQGRSQEPRLSEYDVAAQRLPAGRGAALMAPDAAWAVTDILADVPPPPGLGRRLTGNGGRRIAFKTGTSYGFRDAWAVGYDEFHTVAVWVGRPDGAPNIGAYGIGAAAPLLVRLFDLLPVPLHDVASRRPEGSVLALSAGLPGRLARFEAGDGRAGPPLRILFPRDGSRIGLQDGGRAGASLQLKGQGGVPPYRWFVDGKAIPSDQRDTARWQPDGPGQVDVTVIDRAGRGARVSFWME